MGCHAVSAFAGIGKVKPLKKLLNKKEYQRTFQQLGENWLMPEDLLMQLEAFVCDIYGAKNGISDVNQCRYSVIIMVIIIIIIIIQRKVIIIVIIIIIIILILIISFI